MAHPRQTKHIQFSEWREQDDQLADQLWGNPQVTRYISRNGFDRATITHRLALEVTSQKADGVQYWPLFTAAGDLIGCCGLQARSDAQVYELGYHLLPRYWGQGLATEAASAVIAFAQTRLHAHALVARHHPDNAASRHIITAKLGFKFTHNEVYAPTGLVTPTYRLPLRTPQATAQLRFGIWQAGQAMGAEYLWQDTSVSAAEFLAAEVDTMAKEGLQNWPLYTSTGALVGCCGLHLRADNQYELAYHMRPEYQRRELVIEALSAVVAFARHVRQAPVLMTRCAPDDHQAQAVLSQLGFHPADDGDYRLALSGSSFKRP